MSDLRLYFVTYTDEDSNNMDVFVTATTPQEAFELWRLDFEIDPKDSFHEDHEATVYTVPTPSMVVGVEGWNNLTAEIFPLDFQNLTTLAMRATADIGDHNSRDESVPAS